MTTIAITEEELLIALAKEEFKVISTILVYDEGVNSLNQALEFIYKKKPEFKTNAIFHELFPECFNLVAKQVGKSKTDR